MEECMCTVTDGHCIGCRHVLTLFTGFIFWFVKVP